MSKQPNLKSQGSCAPNKPMSEVKGEKETPRRSKEHRRAFSSSHHHEPGRHHKT